MLIEFHTCVIGPFCETYHNSYGVLDCHESCQEVNLMNDCDACQVIADSAYADFTMGRLDA